MHIGMYSFQDFEKATVKEKFIWGAITHHEGGELYKTAITADQYDRQRNVTIENYVQTLFQLTGEAVEDFTASNNKIASNFFNRLNTQRCMYSMGAGISFLQPDEDATEDKTKEALGPRFDHDIKEAAYFSLIHGVSFCFWNLDRLHVFKVTEFVPLWDEHTGELRAGIRYWRLDDNKPLTAVLYEEDGWTVYRAEARSAKLFEEQPKRPYKTTYRYVPADGVPEVVGEENYGKLPIVPMWTSRLKQSTLIGMRSAIDSYDLIRSGFANDLTDCSMVYWIVENAWGMTDEELAKFRNRLRISHIANGDNDNAKITPYTQEIPYAARKEYLTLIRDGLYEDFGALDVHAVAAGATNDHIDAAYQPMDENADDFEYWVGECIVQILALLGIEDQPVFKRNRISNYKEQVEILVQEAQWLDTPTILRKLPNISADEVAAILDGMEEEERNRMFGEPEEPVEASEEPVGE